MTVTARFATERASRYLQQMCKHFAHKVPAEWTETSGTVRFAPGTCVLDATGNVLTMTCTPADEASLPMLVKVVAVHLERFAFREPPQLVWMRDGVADEALMATLAAMPDPHGQARDDHDAD